tara:strand:- start:19 stop:447 length:429 start_codon:yes stop_codon:yes gene_type:complete
MTTLLDKTDIYIAGYFNALIDTHPELYRLGELRDEECWFQMYKMCCVNDGPLDDYIGLFSGDDKSILLFNTQVIMSNYLKGMGVMGEMAPIGYAEVQYSMDIKSMCIQPCKTSPKIGRSWWKQLGYNSPCSCACKADQMRRY